jgi:hypothetical protein
MTSWRLYLIFLGILLVTSFAWEHIARTYGSQVKPSVGINFIAESAKTIFYKIGVFLSRLSSFLTYIKLGDLFQTAQDLFKPTFELLASPLETIKGYWETALTYKYPVTVTIGSITLVGILLCLWYYFGNKLMFLHFWPLTELPLKKL